MKYFLIAIFLNLLCCFVNAKQIDEATAKKIGKNFLISIGQQNPNFELSLEFKLKKVNRNYQIASSFDSFCYFYIFNRNDLKGFVIVSAEDKVSPILGYSADKIFVSLNMPENLKYWLETYKNQIDLAISENLSQSQEITKLWKDLIEGKVNTSKLNKKGNVNPLIKTEWDQGQFYNELCPFDNQYQAKTLTGCVATAMAQIMKYWNYPKIGKGSDSYYDTVGGNQYANFGSTTYNWSNMPNQLSSTNNDIAVLMYHCGVSVHMDYGVNQKGGSEAYVISPGPNSAQNAYSSFFGYNSNTLEGFYRYKFTESDWINLLKNELDKSRPIQYVGYNFKVNAGHTWVCDGYNSNDFFHMNWGWGGLDNADFKINILDPKHSYTWNDGQAALIGIEPPVNNCSYNLSENVISFPASGGNGTFDILTSTNCNWAAVSNNNSWLTITSAQNGKGNGTITYSVKSNGTLNPIQGSISIEGQTYIVNVMGINCTYSISPSTSQTFSSNGGTGSFLINSTSGCEWTATSSDPSWLHIISNSSGNGNGSLSFSVDPNFETYSRIGTIAVSGQVFTVTLSGVSINCSVKIVPSSPSIIGNYKGSYSFAYNINQGCSYEVLSSSTEWLTIKSGLKGVVNYDVKANSGWYSRTAYVTINKEFKKVIQEGTQVLSINEAEKINIVKIYPNPTNGKLNVELESKNNSSIRMLVYNTLGEVVYSEGFNLEAGFVNSFKLDISVPNGIYNLVLISNDFQINKLITIF